MTEFSSKYRDDSAASLGLSFAKVYNKWHKQIKDALQAIELTHPQFIVLASLAYLSQDEVEVNQVALSRQSGIDVMTVSTILKNLEKNNLVKREVSLTDTRAKTIKMTATGMEKVNEATPIIEKIDQEFFAVLGDKQAELNQILQKLVNQ
ncbi:MarR family winged helix-turn-helix transcriptional regulator [Lactobacillus sp. B4007]|uniref:MarR family winged helix-turn-helix transcriptional regulator n=1 Tax=Lactobacillus sp. B4007 TaxID=2818032 RepID=UPI002269C49A|nr:MarR family winged helix-turn-helix transcriptional regulator [Lactobacillus sp. B4007]MCX8725086.1 winged helix-turn-helix transcriptional regulator [Lactobacillus sp. B4007]